MSAAPAEPVAVIGAGWGGLAAAVELVARAGVRCARAIDAMLETTT